MEKTMEKRDWGKAQGLRLSEAIKKSGFGREALCVATATNSPAVLARYEDGTYPPTEEAVKRLSKALNISVEWLLYGKEKAPKPDTAEIGRRLKALREAKKLSRAAVAKKLGVTEQSLKNWENGKTTPLPDRLEDLASLYEVKITDIVESREKWRTLQVYAESRRDRIESARRAVAAHKLKAAKAKVAKTDPKAPASKTGKKDKAQVPVKAAAPVPETEKAQTPAKEPAPAAAETAESAGISEATQWVARKVRDIRAQKGISLEEAAARLAMSRADYAELESGRHELTLADLSAFCRLLSTDINVLISGAFAEKWYAFQSRRALELFGVAGAARDQGFLVDDSGLDEGQILIYGTKDAVLRLFKCLGHTEGVLIE